MAAVNCSKQANTLVALVLKNGHRVAVHVQLYLRYWDILRSHKNSQHHPFLCKTLNMILTNSNANVFVPELAADPKTIPVRHRKDVFLGQLALAVENESPCVVSEDKKTREDIRKKMGITALSLRDSLRYAGKPREEE
ncbi:MAG: hypothetical protein HY671_02465 [Chloroflexi bacterium]|nr:hypothetical protein [Chloroflexota bacterium]